MTKLVGCKAVFDPEDFKPVQEKITSKSVWKKSDQVEPLLTVTTVLSCVCPPVKKSCPTVTSLRVQRKSVLQLAVWAGCSYHLGQKVLRICTFLPTECLSPGFGTAMTPPLAPPWSKLFSQGQKWSTWPSTLFFLGGGEAGSIIL